MSHRACPENHFKIVGLTVHTTTLSASKHKNDFLDTEAAWCSNGFTAPANICAVRAVHVRLTLDKTTGKLAMVSMMHASARMSMKRKVGH